eukprot:14273911-Alexandrium_andersonii.AAC.1
MDLVPASSAQALMEDAGRCFCEAAILAARAERRQEMAEAVLRQEREEEEPGYEGEAVDHKDFEQEIQLTFKPQDREP